VLRLPKSRTALGAVALFLSLAGCHEMGSVGPLDPWRAREIVGEIARVDERAREIEIRADEGRMRTVRYDQRTRVLYRQKEYAVVHLEPGDYVAVRVVEDGRGLLYAEEVRVREAVQERAVARLPGGRLERLEGTVEYVNDARGLFELRQRSGRRVLVTLPYGAPRAVVDRLRRLREGDRVRVEGYFVNPERFEVEAFL
jgi:hypothetical protein